MGVGFAKDGESQIRKNTALRDRVKSKYFLKQNYKIKKDQSILFQKATPEELKKIRRKLAKQRRKDKVVSIIVVVLLIILILFILL